MSSLITNQTNEINPSIRLSPFNKLYFDNSNNTSILNKYFNTDWRKGWFHLAANKMNVNGNPTFE
jgi:hypothetical protein